MEREINHDKLFLLNKSAGDTPLQALQDLRKSKPELENSSLTYAGRLDPMAEGLLIVLADEEIKNKSYYLSLDKTYEAELLLGFKTDTGDLLGLAQENINPMNYTEEGLKEILKSLTGDVTLPLPKFSSVPFEGKALFQWAREGREVNPPERTTKIFSLEFIASSKIDKDDLKKELHEKINRITGDFRQQEILDKWSEILAQNPHTDFQLIKIKVKSASGTYIRSLAEKIGQKLNSEACLYSLKRTEIGPFMLKLAHED